MLLAIGVVLLSAHCTRERPFAKVKTGGPLPGVEMASLEGGKVRFDQFKGRPLLVNFWASNCIPCRKEFPRMKAAQESNPDLAIVGVIFQDSPKAALGFMTSFDAAWPSVDDPDEQVARLFGVTRPPGIPQTFFVDASGIVRSRIFGEMSEEVLNLNLAKITPSGN